MSEVSRILLYYEIADKECYRSRRGLSTLCNREVIKVEISIPPCLYL
nr:MAG TPA: hypothetical protein [Caudoviricetes sp.]